MTFHRRLQLNIIGFGVFNTFIERFMFGWPWKWAIVAGLVIAGFCFWLTRSPRKPRSK